MAKKGLSSVALLLAGLAACGGGAPSSPSGGGSGTVTSITVTVTSPLKVGQTAQAEATAAIGGGGTQPVTSGWQSAAPGVASVTPSGLVTALANGSATIFVASGGRQGQQVVRVVPDYDGQWSGSYLVTACADSGYFTEQRFCAGTLNSTVPMRLLISQSGTAVAVSFFLGQLAFPSSSATIGADGSLPIGDTTLDETVRITASWTLQQPSPGALSGTVRQRWTIAGRDGEGTLDGRIIEATRTTGPPAAVDRAPPVTLSSLRRAVESLGR